MSKIFVTRRIPEIGLQRLREHHQVEVWPEDGPPDRATLLQKVAGCGGILCMLSDRVDAELMDAAGRELKGIANFAVGYNNIDIQQAAARGIAVGNTPGALTDATADIAVGLMLAAGRSFQSALHNVHSLGWKNWEPLGFLGQEFTGRTIGIIGMGRIGAAVAKRLRFGWDMRVLYTSRTPKTQCEESLGAMRVSLETLLEQSDVVSIHTSLQPETRGLIGASQLQRMQPHAILINTSRGEVLDQSALYEALRSARIFAAGLDVTDPEPLPGDNPLRQLPNCIILPHIGSATYVARDRMARMAADNLIAAIAGAVMPHPVG